MIRRFITGLLTILTFGAAPALAGDWRPLDAMGIAEALIGRTLKYESAWQDFRASGRTLYNAGSDSWGTWTTRGDQYCSQWPPSAAWNCFDVAISGDATQIRFRGAGNDISIGTYKE